MPAPETIEQQAMVLRERLAEREAALAAVQQEAAELRQRLSEKEVERAGVTKEVSMAGRPLKLVIADQHAAVNLANGGAATVLCES